MSMHKMKIPSVDSFSTMLSIITNRLGDLQFTGIAETRTLVLPFEIELFESATLARALSSTVRVGIPDTDTNVCTGNSATLANQTYNAPQIVICRARDSVAVQNVEVRSGASLEIFSKSIGSTDFIAK